MCRLVWLSFFSHLVYTQFYIAGLREISHEEPQMHQNSWWPGLCPGPHWGSLQRSSRSLSRWGGGSKPLPSKPPPQELHPGSPRRTLPPAQPFELRPFGPHLDPQCRFRSDATGYGPWECRTLGMADRNQHLYHIFKSIKSRVRLG